ncbi:MAG: hypothetical protein GY937_14455 [bacterium]|nr:hypothetical protein [bacterium]
MLLSTGRDLTAQVLPPRSTFVNFPMGNPFGHPQDAETQRAILLATLQLAETAVKGGTLVDLDYEWDRDFATVLD